MFSVLCSLYRQGRVTEAHLTAYVTAGAITETQKQIILDSGGNCGAWLAAMAAEVDADLDASTADAIAATAEVVAEETGTPE